MKIVFTSLFQDGMGGGAGRVAHELAGAFGREGHQVVMICPMNFTGLQDTGGEVLTYGVRSAGDDDFHMPVLTGRIVRSIFDFLNEFKPDVIHAHDPALIGLIGQVWAKMNQVPFVHTAHVLPSKALEFGTSDALNVRLLKSSLSETITHRVLDDFYTNCDALIALNQSAHDSIREFGYQGRVFVIPNGRNLSKYQPCRPADITAEEKIVTFIGYINRRKNQSYLLQTLRYLPDDVRLQFVGRPLDEEYKKELDEIIERYELKAVEFLGQVPHEQIPALLEETHVFPSASKMEVQSLVVIEALASGTPVVGLSNETIDELVNEHVGGRLPKETEPDRFAEEIQRILELNPEQYREMSRQARERVSHLDWSKIVKVTARSYRELQQEEITFSREGSAVLEDLVGLFTTGEVEKYLKDRLAEYRRQWRTGKLLERLNIPERLFSWIRVPTSTWLISGVTIVVSVLGYLFMKGKKDA
jgi:glycosyltransferase involved in cell wall biosynthesis